MNEHSLNEVIIRAIPIVMLLFITAITIRRVSRNPLARGGPFAAKLSGLCIDDPALRARVVAALEERRRMEPISLFTKIFGAVWICGCLAVLAAGFAGAIPRAQIPLWYAAICLSLAATTMYAYFQMRNPQPIRVAVLQARSSASVVPPYWFAAACASAALALAFTAQPGVGVAAILVCASSLVTTVIAWQLTGLPARLAGKDIEIERFVDDSLRLRRTAKVLILAIIQPYFFMCLESRDANAMQMAAFILTIALFLGFVVWMARAIRCKPTLNGAAV